MPAKFITTFSLLAIGTTLPAWSLDDIPYGVEAVAQYRSEYNYRGFQLADTTTSFQLGARYAFDDTSYLNVAGWHDTEVGDGDFTEAGALLELGKDIGDASFTLSGAYRSYSNSTFESGADIAATASYLFTEQLSSTAKVAYDTGAEGFYASLEGAYYLRVNDDSYFNFTAGVSFTEDYYQLSGVNDAFAKLSYTYNVNSSVSISPYVGTSILLDNDEVRQDSLYSGLYFAVSF